MTLIDSPIAWPPIENRIAANLVDSVERLNQTRSKIDSRKLAKLLAEKLPDMSKRALTILDVLRIVLNQLKRSKNF